MASFCGRCGSGLDPASGLCPNCDCEQFAAQMQAQEAFSAAFCGNCGGSIDPQTGICPNCGNGGFQQTANAYYGENGGYQPVENNYYEEIGGGQQADNTYYVENNGFQPMNTAPAVAQKPAKKASVGTTIVTVLLALVLVITSLVWTTIFQIRGAMNEDNIEDSLNQVQVSDLLNEMDLISSRERREFYTYLDQNYGIQISDRKIDDFIERTTIKKFLSEKISDCCDDVFEDEVLDITFSRRDVRNLLMDNRDVIYDEFGVYLDDYQLNDIASQIMVEERVAATVDLREQLPDGLYDLVYVVLSYTTMTIFLVISLLVVFLMLKNNLSQGLCTAGTVFLVLGGLACLVALFANWLTPQWADLWGGELMGKLLSSILLEGIWINLIMAIVGIGMLCAKKIFVKKK
ncbi:MAG: hypothetical protein IKT68_06605 [Clostridia bacterium]|nr:hypothetical protein [Clostridia bacterium]